MTNKTEKHTPGPWVVGTGWIFRAVTSNPHGGGHIGVREDTHITFRETDIGRANARLIAAAPDLLEAAKQALALLDGKGIGITAHNLRAAIAKAEGR